VLAVDVDGSSQHAALTGVVDEIREDVGEIAERISDAGPIAHCPQMDDRLLHQVACPDIPS